MQGKDVLRNIHENLPPPARPRPVRLGCGGGWCAMREEFNECPAASVGPHLNEWYERYANL